MENEQLVARIQAGEDVAENMLKLYDQNKGFIAKVAKKYQGLAELDDLLQEGYIGLSEAVDHFDAGRGVSFIHYAAFWIRQGMKRYVDNCGGTIRLPVHAREDVYEYNRAVKEYRRQFGEWPSDCALCSILDVSRENYRRSRKASRSGRYAVSARRWAGKRQTLRLGTP